MKVRRISVLVCLLMVAALVFGTSPLLAQGKPNKPAKAAKSDSMSTEGGTNVRAADMPKTTSAQRQQAAANNQAKGLFAGQGAKQGLTPTPGGTPDYFGPYPNYANSPLPELQANPAPTFYFAEGTCRPNFDSYFCIQNPGLVDATVLITYMKGNGSTDTQTLTVIKNSRSTINVKDKLGSADDAAHDFSATVQCTNGQQIVAERPMYFNYHGIWTGGHDVVGATAPQAAWWFAEGTCRPQFDPWICIQNPGATDADVTITYMKGDGSTASQQVTVPKNSRVTVDPRLKLGTGDDAAHDFSFKVECTNGQNIVAERPMYFNYKGVWTGGHDVVGATAPAPTFYFAEGTTRPNFDPYICIQNPGSTDAAVTVTYMKGDSNTATQKLTVPKNSRQTITPATVLGSANDAVHDFSAAVACTNNQNIVAERPMYFNYQGQWTGGHDVVGATSTQTTFDFAEGTCRPGFDPYICIQNPGILDATVSITYMKGDATTVSDSLVVPGSTRRTVTPRTLIGTGDDPAHDFSITVTSTNGEPILAERPMYFNYHGIWTGGHDVIGYTFTTSSTAVPGTGIRKFVDSLPGLGAANANDLGQYIPVAVPDKTSFPGDDYYEIELGQYTEQLHKDLPPTLLRGYRQTNGPDNRYSYLGPMIIAQRNVPVRVKFTNGLPTGSGGNLFIPVDTTIMGAGAGPSGGSYTQNRAVIHLHGGNTPWISDGTMHQWITPAGESTSYPQGVSVKNVPDMPQPVVGDGTETFYYTNQQSARLMFYHDHAYGITRLNVYAGEAAPYILQDSAEQSLVTNNVIPATQIPLVIQDKTFVPNDAQLNAEDPTWDKTKYGGEGNLWFPHVYMPNQNPYDPSGANAMGRWDYGPWFWPPFTGLINGPVANPYASNGPWEPPVIPGTPNPSIVPEGFMDTPVVNGTAYPYVKVGPKAYRFRILNACNDRYMNLQLYFAKSNGQMWNPTDGTLTDGNAGEVPMVAAAPNTGLPTTWPTDGRDGGVPDPKAVGPNFIQIGTEGGFLPQATEIPNTPVGYDYNRRSIVVLNVLNKSLFLGPAERADVIIDFSNVPDGSKLILYNDSPAPVPGFDPRYDYYTGDPDQTTTGGAPSTVPGYGPNTRTLMQFQVSSNTPGGMSGFNFNTLQTALPAAYAASQPPPIVPQAPYNAAFNANYPSNNFLPIQAMQANFFNGPVNGINITSPGSGYSSAPLVGITGGGGAGAAATANISGVTALNLTIGGTGYTTTPLVTIAGGGGTGATADAQINGLTNIGVSAPGSGYTAVPTVQIVGGGGTGASAVATINMALGTVSGINLTNGGSGYTSAPSVQLVGGNGTGAAGTAVVGTGQVTGLIITNSGTGYAGAPGVTIQPPGGVAHTTATANAVISAGAVTGINMTSGGTGFSSAPTVSLTGGGGANATAVAVGVNMDMQPKAIQELFDADYGRMNATLGVELPNTTMNTQTTIPYAMIDPPTELLKSSNAAAPIGSLADGTQIWKITHNGVDTHAIHFHLFNVQLINRVGWDGAIRPPDENEVGWKDTVRMNPLEDAIVALRPMAHTGLPWQVPNSHRLLDPTMPSGSSMGFTNIDPTNEPAAVTNVPINFGWEYVWHCHLLGHEENDMMRPMSLGTGPVAPSGLSAIPGAVGIVNLSWTDNSINETNWTIQRSVNATGPWTTIATPASTTETTTGPGITFADHTPYSGTPYWYRVVASNVIGDTTAYTPPVAGYPNMSVDSTPTAASGPVTPL